IRAVALACLLGCPARGLARPRAPLPVITPPGSGVVYRERFDWPLFNGITDSEVVVSNGVTLHESWSGYALERIPSTGLAPFVIPGVDALGHTNIASDAGSTAIRFWVTPYWSSSTVSGENTGPGTYAHLADLVAIGG